MTKAAQDVLVKMSTLSWWGASARKTHTTRLGPCTLLDVLQLLRHKSF